MTNIQDMNEIELTMVSGGAPAEGQSWVDYLNERFPGGEWVGNSFFPNGVPEGWGS